MEEDKPASPTPVDLFTELLTNVAMRIMVREGHGSCLINHPYPHHLDLDALPKSLQAVVNVKDKTFSGLFGKLSVYPMYLNFDLCNPDHIFAITRLRQMLGLCRIPTLFSLASTFFFKAHPKVVLKPVSDEIGKKVQCAIFQTDDLAAVKTWFSHSFQTESENETHYYSPLWASHFPELYVLNDPKWFYRRANVDGYFPSPRTNARRIMAVLCSPQAGSRGRTTDLSYCMSNVEFSDSLIAVLLEGSDEQVKTLIKLYAETIPVGGVKAYGALIKIYDVETPPVSPLLLLCLRNIFDDEIFNEVYNEAHRSKIFGLHEPMTCIAAACYHGNFAMFHWLREKGEKLDHETVCLLDHAIRGKQEKMCEYLVESLSCTLRDVRYLFENFTPELYRLLMRKRAISGEQVTQLIKLADETLSSGAKLNDNQAACVQYLDVRPGDSKHIIFKK